MKTHRLDQVHNEHCKALRRWEEGIGGPVTPQQAARRIAATPRLHAYLRATAKEIDSFCYLVTKQIGNVNY